MSCFTPTSQFALHIKWSRATPILHHSPHRLAVFSPTWTFRSALRIKGLLTTSNIQCSSHRLSDPSLKVISWSDSPTKRLLSTFMLHYLFHRWAVTCHLTHINHEIHPTYKRVSDYVKSSPLSSKFRREHSSDFYFFSSCSSLFCLISNPYQRNDSYMTNALCLVIFFCYCRSIFIKISGIAS